MPQELEIVMKLVRHGYSKINAGEFDGKTMADWAAELHDDGHKQAIEAGKKLEPFLNEPDASLFVFRSPYIRVRQTTGHILVQARLQDEPDGRPSIRVYEDDLLREVDHGYYDLDEQAALRKVHGYFYYRYNGGESAADCCDRQGMFLNSMMRQIERKIPQHAYSAGEESALTKQKVNVLIGGHGLQIRCFVKRFFHLSIEEFDTIANPHNCDIITIAPRHLLQEPQFSSSRWGVEGLRSRTDSEANTKS